MPLSSEDLPAPLWPNSPTNAPLADREVDLVEHLEGAIGDVDAANLKHRRPAPDIRE